jgi:glycosyltransferase involved in cell wall biosynthesis
MLIGVITPSYKREKILRRFLTQLVRQTYPDWKAVVVHDGHNPAVESLVATSHRRDPRIAYRHTEHRSNNFGVTPRCVGLRYMIEEVGADYCVFWDDDNYFFRDALSRIAEGLEQAGYPDVLLMPVSYDGAILPPRDATVDQLRIGQVDTSCFVVKPELALDRYETMLAEHGDEEAPFFYTQDGKLFEYLYRSQPPVRICKAPGRRIALHNGLTSTAFVREYLGIPPLKLAARFRKVRSLFGLRA